MSKRNAIDLNKYILCTAKKKRTTTTKRFQQRSSCAESGRATKKITTNSNNNKYFTGRWFLYFGATIGHKNKTKTAATAANKLNTQCFDMGRGATIDRLQKLIAATSAQRTFYYQFAFEFTRRADEAKINHNAKNIIKLLFTESNHLCVSESRSLGGMRDVQF